MGLLQRKKKFIFDENLSEICSYFYRYEVFGNPDYYNLAFQYVTLGRVHEYNYELFIKELEALRIELFGLKLMYRHQSMKDNETNWYSSLKGLAIEIAFTKSYLESSARSNIWKKIGSYNGCFTNLIVDKEPATLKRLCKIFPIGLMEIGSEATSKMHDSKWNIDFYRKCLEKSISDSDCLTRVSNRAAYKEEDWGDLIKQALAEKLAINLNCVETLGWEEMLKFQRLVNSMYMNAELYIDALPYRQEHQERAIRYSNALHKVLENIQESKK